MTNRIATFAAPLIVAASMLTGCATELDGPTDDRALDDTIQCSECVAAAADPELDVVQQAVPVHPTVADLSMTTIHSQLFKGDWPVEEVVVQAYDGGLDAEDRAMIEQMLEEAQGVDFALATLAMKIDDGGVLTGDELDLIDMIESKLGDILYPEVKSPLSPQ